MSLKNIFNCSTIVQTNFKKTSIDHDFHLSLQGIKRLFKKCGKRKTKNQENGEVTVLKGSSMEAELRRAEEKRISK